MICYLRQLLDTKYFGDPSEYPEIIKILNKDYYNSPLNYSSRLIRNFYYMLDIKIPPDFMDLIKDNGPLYRSMEEIPLLPDKVYFKETPITISIDELYDEFHYLNETRTSQYLYYINIINYSTFCVKHKSIGEKYDILIDTDDKENESTLKSPEVNKLLHNLLKHIVDALETFNYNEIFGLYKTYLSLPYQIYYYHDESKQLFGGTNPLKNPLYNTNKLESTFTNIRNWIFNDKVFYYFSFNTINEIQFSLFEFTNIVLVTINEEKNIHGKLHNMIWNLQHDVIVHLRLIRASNTSLIESNRLYTLLKYILENTTDENLYIFPWAISNECAHTLNIIEAQQIFPFNLYDLRRMIHLRKGISTSLIKTYNYDMIYDLLLLLKEIKIIDFDDKTPNKFHIIDKKWEYVHKEYTDEERDIITRNELFNFITIKKRYKNETDLLIEEIKTDSRLYIELQKDKEEAIDRARKRYEQKNILYGGSNYLKKYIEYGVSEAQHPRLNKDVEHLYLKYKQKYLKLKNSNK